MKEEIKVKGSLIATEPDVLVISITERQSDQKIVTSLIKLQGTWKTNLKNQIQFEIEKESGTNDVLTFRSSWHVGDHHEIVYSYEETHLESKSKTTQELIFKGTWDISEKNRLTYFLGGNSESAFRFKGTFQTKSILAKKNEIHYQIGIEVNGKHEIKTIVREIFWPCI